MRVPPEIREALTALMAQYAMAIDDNRLEDWVDLFDEACDYKVVTRENVEQGLPNVLMWCDNKNMLRDRVESVSAGFGYLLRTNVRVGLDVEYSRRSSSRLDRCYDRTRLLGSASYGF